MFYVPLCFNRQKKCHVRNIGSHNASAGYSRTKRKLRLIFKKYFIPVLCRVSVLDAIAMEEVCVLDISIRAYLGYFSLLYLAD